MRKTLLATTLFGASLLASKNALAWFQICNEKANGAGFWTTYAFYEPNITQVTTNVCGDGYSVFPPAYYSAWRNTGWWYLNKGQCAIVYGPNLSNTWGYVYAQGTDGSTLTNANTPFEVSNVAFALDQYASGPYNCNAASAYCLGTSGGPVCNAQPSYWTVNTLPVYQGGYPNFTFTIN